MEFNMNEELKFANCYLYDGNFADLDEWIKYFEMFEMFEMFEKFEFKLCY